MAGGFNSAKQKQAELARKLEQAKKQCDAHVDNESSTKPDYSPLEDPYSEFAQLLAKSQPLQSERRSEGITCTTNASKNKTKMKDKTLKKRKDAATVDKKTNNKGNTLFATIESGLLSSALSVHALNIDFLLYR
jgi:hypothetical protein